METHTIIAYHLCTYTWALTYIGIIYRGFKDQSYGMPIVPLTLNLAWEIVFALFIPPYGSADSELIPYGGLKAQVIFLIWATLDIVILYTYFKYGHKYFQRSYNLSKGHWIGFTVFMMIFSFFIMYYGGLFFWQFEVYFNNDQIEGAKMIAFIQNAIMSISFIAMYYMRGNTDGQSFTIAWAKWIGTSMTGGIIYMLTRPEDGKFVITFIVAIFVADVYYMWLMYRALKKQGINPWTRL
ncbi:hypothetical protein [Pararhodobacter sp. CCB-MM2]|uniref:transmembrane-type terpene cyclase n=1 Tax=Pararhodobacter sp. CCB-MM2 TaxID=1786003 RepID=UPI00082D6EEF|nr:hypothetical protein [Pararhodobacter sp. CCB-MM2]MCA2010058.1 hypothetical protein [Cereibacter sphaeroides]